MKNDIRKKALEEFVRRAKEKYGDKIEKIILFGSYARGEAKRESDIDVLVITKRKDLALERNIIDLSFEILIEFSVDVSPKVYSREEVDAERKLKSPFILEIEQEGVALAWKN